MKAVKRADLICSHNQKKKKKKGQRIEMAMMGGDADMLSSLVVVIISQNIKFCTLDKYNLHLSLHLITPQ